MLGSLGGIFSFGFLTSELFSSFVFQNVHLGIKNIEGSFFVRGAFIRFLCQSTQLIIELFGVHLGSLGRRVLRLALNRIGNGWLTRLLGLQPRPLFLHCRGDIALDGGGLDRIRSDLGTVDFKNRRGSRSRSGGSGSLSLLVLDAGNGIRQQHTGSQSHTQFRIGRGHGIGDLAKRIGFTFNGPNHTHRLRRIGIHPHRFGRLTKLARSQTGLVMHARLTSVNTFIEVLCHSPDFVVHVSDELHEVFQSHLGLLRATQTHGTQDLIGVRQSRIVILLASLFLSEDVLAHGERNAIQTHVVARGMCILHSLQQTFGHLQSTQLLRRDVEQTSFSMLEDFLSHLQVATIRGNLGHHQVVLNSFLTFRRCQSSFTQINGLRGWHFGH